MLKEIPKLSVDFKRMFTWHSAPGTIMFGEITEHLLIPRGSNGRMSAIHLTIKWTDDREFEWRTSLTYVERFVRNFKDADEFIQLRLYPDAPFEFEPDKHGGLIIAMHVRSFMVWAESKGVFEMIDHIFNGVK